MSAGSPTASDASATADTPTPGKAVGDSDVTVASAGKRNRPPLSYPVDGQGWDANTFLRQSAEVLRDPETVVYVDTSFVMWLTKGGDDSRQQFIAWAATFGDRIHVPLWTYHEYYRHHNHDTLRAELAEERTKLVEAVSRYTSLARQYADDPFEANFSAGAFHRELDDVVKKVMEVTNKAAGWNYTKAAKQISDWMAGRLCRSSVVFDLMDRLGHVGETRYTQDLPPGYRDRIKKDTEKKGSNKFGDLILWEEMLAHVAGTANVKTVVLLTRDRKDDWFAKADQAAIDGDLRRVTGKERWNPVPAPHPTLVMELRERTQADHLVLLDSLYFGATLHQAGSVTHSRLIAYALGIGPRPYVATAVQLAPEGGRASSQPLSKRNARAVCATASMPPDPTALPASITPILASLNGPVPAGEEFIERFQHDELPGKFQDAAVLARLVSDAALQEQMHLSRKMVEKLLALLRTMPADKAAAVYAGMLASAYFDEVAAREVPRAWQLQELFDLMADEVFDGVSEAMHECLTRADSPALFLPTAKPAKLPVRVTFDLRQAVTPLAVQQIAVGEHNLMAAMGPAFPGNLSLVFSQETVSIDDLLRHVVDRYGLPEGLLDLQGVGRQDLTTISPSRGFIGVRDSKSVEDAEDMPTDAAIENMDVDAANLPDEDELEMQEFLSEDSDE